MNRPNPVEIIIERDAGERKIYEASPELLAELFARLDNNDQARFFNRVAEVADTWSNGGWPFQLQYVTESELTLGGRRVMQMIGEYSHWGLSCNLADEVTK